MSGYEIGWWICKGLMAFWVFMTVATIGWWFWILAKERKARDEVRGLDDAWHPGLDQPLRLVARVERRAAPEEVDARVQGRNRQAQIPHGGG